MGWSHKMRMFRLSYQIYEHLNKMVCLQLNCWKTSNIIKTWKIDWLKNKCRLEFNNYKWNKCLTSRSWLQWLVIQVLFIMGRLPGIIWMLSRCYKVERQSCRREAKVYSLLSKVLMLHLEEARRKKHLYLHKEKRERLSYSHLQTLIYLKHF